MDEKILCCYVGQKVNKIRFKPEPMDDSQYFITGSMAGEYEKNLLTLWYFPYEAEDIDDIPYKVMSTNHNGDVMALQFLDNSLAVCSSSQGDVQLLQVTQESIKSEHVWKELHLASGPTALSSYEEDIASVGGDGALALLTASQQQPVRIIAKADSCPLSCVAFHSHHKVVTGNVRGHLKMWDLRSSEDSALACFVATTNGVASTCVTSHPTQRHLMLAGALNGAITLWDLRHTTYPINTLHGHSTAVSEIVCHKERPDQFMSCSWSGDLLHWNVNNHPWTSADSSKTKMLVNSILTPLNLPINSVDVNRTRAICAADNEAIYLFNDIPVD